MAVNSFIENEAKFLISKCFNLPYRIESIYPVWIQLFLVSERTSFFIFEIKFTARVRILIIRASLIRPYLTDLCDPRLFYRMDFRPKISVLLIWGCFHSTCHVWNLCHCYRSYAQLQSIQRCRTLQWSNSISRTKKLNYQPK